MRYLWFLSICLSLALHLLLLAGIPGFNFSRPEPEKFKSLEILSREEIQVENSRKINNRPLDLAKPPQFIKEFSKKTILRSSDDFLLEKPLIEAPSKEIIFSEIDMEELMEIKKTPEYMDYYNLIREKIRDNALAFYQRTMQGVVHLSFIILDNGQLYHLSLLDDSSSDPDLLQIAKNSVKKAAPFPPFPSELAYPKLHFNISIHFKNN